MEKRGVPRDFCCKPEPLRAHYFSYWACTKFYLSCRVKNQVHSIIIQTSFTFLQYTHSTFHCSKLHARSIDGLLFSTYFANICLLLKIYESISNNATSAHSWFVSFTFPPPPTHTHTHAHTRAHAHAHAHTHTHTHIVFALVITLLFFVQLVKHACYF